MPSTRNRTGMEIGRTVRHAAVLLCAGLPLLLSPADGAFTTSYEAKAFLAAAFEVTDAEFTRTNRGEVVSRSLDVSDRREVATFGLVRLPVAPEVYVEQLADIATFKRDDAVLQIGTFGSPPDRSDVDTLTLEEADLQSLRTCNVGNCGVQLPASAISRFRQEVDWRRPDADRQANALMREILSTFVADYIRGGPDASMQYADETPVVDLGSEFIALMEPAHKAWNGFPSLRRHLLAFPDRGDDISDVVYWSKDRVGRKAVATITHLAIARTTGHSPADYAIASKHLYGTHYFEASVGLTVLVRDRSSVVPATYLAYLNRTRLDLFGGVLGGIARKIITSKTRATVEHHLARLQKRF